MKQYLNKFFLFLFSLFFPSLNSLTYGKEFKKLQILLNGWKLNEAEKEIEILKKAGEISQIDENIFRSDIAFLKGEYGKAIEIIEKEIPKGSNRKILERIDLYKRTQEATKGFKSYKVEGGKFIIFLNPGIDEILIPYLRDTLMSASVKYLSYFDDIGDFLIRVEIYPDIETLANVSGISLDEIEKSGTVGLCKYNRIMIVSPRDLIYGYPWLDTISHEFVHYLLIFKYNDTIPLWLQEGIAKYLEGVWRNAEKGEMDIYSQSILKEKIKRGRLLSLREMEGGLSRLPTQKDVLLAFSQLNTLIQYIVKTSGMEGLKRILYFIANGYSPSEGIKKVCGNSLQLLLKKWKTYVRKMDLKSIPFYDEIPLMFKSEFKKKEDENFNIEYEKARKMAHIGDLFVEKGLLQPALIEYEKAYSLVKENDPYFLCKIAGIYLKNNKFNETLDLLKSSAKFFEKNVLINLYLAKAYSGLKKFASSLPYLINVVRVNPFDPDVHKLLHETYNELNMKKEAEVEKKAQSILQTSFL